MRGANLDFFRTLLRLDLTIYRPLPGRSSVLARTRSALWLAPHQIRHQTIGVHRHAVSATRIAQALHVSNQILLGLGLRC